MDGRTAAPTLETLLAEREWVGALARVLVGTVAAPAVKVELPAR